MAAGSPVLLSSYPALLTGTLPSHLALSNMLCSTGQSFPSEDMRVLSGLGGALLQSDAWTLPQEKKTSQFT